MAVYVPRRPNSIDAVYVKGAGPDLIIPNEDWSWHPDADPTGIIPPLGPVIKRGNDFHHQYDGGAEGAIYFRGSRPMWCILSYKCHVRPQTGQNPLEGRLAIRSAGDFGGAFIGNEMKNWWPVPAQVNSTHPTWDICVSGSQPILLGVDSSIFFAISQHNRSGFGIKLRLFYIRIITTGFGPEGPEEPT